MSLNSINGLFHIPDEGSFLKKLILANETIFNKDIEPVFKLLKESYKEIELIQRENYFALMLPTVSPGVKLEAMFITTLREGVKLLSIYHRLHFDEDIYGAGRNLIEADAFLRISTVLVNVPIEGHIEGLAYVMNYQIKEALNIEVTMLTLSDANENIAVENILPFVMNAVARYMLACSLDGVDYHLPATSDDLARLVADYCDLPLLTALRGIGNLSDWQSDVEKSAHAFISEYASSTSCLMFLYIRQDRLDDFLDKGFKVIKDYLLASQELYGLESVVGDAQTLNRFQRIDLDEIRDDIAQKLEENKAEAKRLEREEKWRLTDML